MLTLMSAVRLEGVVAPMLLDGPVNAETFAGYVEECLVPALEADDILIMDNLPAHKTRGSPRRLRMPDASSSTCHRIRRI